MDPPGKELVGVALPLRNGNKGSAFEMRAGIRAGPLNGINPILPQCPLLPSKPFPSLAES